MAAEAEQSAPTGERFEPAFMHGRIIEAEHLARYAWATQFASGCRVLDAACGAGYGSQMLAEGGASEVIGIDIAEAAIDAARALAAPHVSFELADMHKLPFGDDEFDLIICFEAIEHVADPEAVLEELRRVLRPQGLMVLSTPNRDVYAPGNPFHLRELKPSELDSILSDRFRNVSCHRQHTWVASGIFDDETFRLGDNQPLGSVDVFKATENSPGSETYTLALASDAELPDVESVVDLSSDIDLREWSERLRLAEYAIEAGPEDRDLRQQAEVERLREELNGLREQLARAEEEIGRHVEAESRLEEAQEALDDYVTSSEVMNSLSWKVTKPLRRLSAAARRFRS